MSAVWEVDGVSDISIEQNRTSANKTIRGITLSPHSIYLCVNGGLADDIAQAIFYSLSGGCDTTATSTSVVGSYTDPYSNVQDTYNIDRPTNVPISVKIGIMASVSEETKEQIKNAIISDWQGQTGDSVFLPCIPLSSPRIFWRPPFLPRLRQVRWPGFPP